MPSSGHDWSQSSPVWQFQLDVHQTGAWFHVICVGRFAADRPFALAHGHLPTYSRSAFRGTFAVNVLHCARESILWHPVGWSHGIDRFVSPFAMLPSWVSWIMLVIQCDRGDTASTRSSARGQVVAANDVDHKVLKNAVSRRRRC